MGQSLSWQSPDSIINELTGEEDIAGGGALQVMAFPLGSLHLLHRPGLFLGSPFVSQLSSLSIIVVFLAVSFVVADAFASTDLSTEFFRRDGQDRSDL